MRKLKTSEIAVVRSEILKQQGGVCPLCCEPIAKPALDHDHVLGHVRGVLCLNCNGIEGRIRNYTYRAKRHLSPLDWLQNLTAYLQWHQTDKTGLEHPTHKTPEEKKAAAAAKRKKKRNELQ